MMPLDSVGFEFEFGLKHQMMWWEKKLTTNPTVIISCGHKTMTLSFKVPSIFIDAVILSSLCKRLALVPQSDWFMLLEILMQIGKYLANKLANKLVATKVRFIKVEK